MDPLTSVVTALAAGAAAALQSTVEQGVKDGYAALKGLIQRKYAQVSLDQLEANPSSKSRRGVAEEELKAVGADRDTEVLQKAQELLEIIQRQAPEVATAIGVDPKDIEEAALTIRRVIATGIGVKVEQGKFSGDITIEDVQAGESGGPPKPLVAAGVEPAAVLQLDQIIIGRDLTFDQHGQVVSAQYNADRAIYVSEAKADLRSLLGRWFRKLFWSGMGRPWAHKPATSTLQWNTGFPYDATAEKVRVLFVGVPYLLRTAIQAGENTIGGLTPGGTVQPPSEGCLGVTAEGERFFTVRFRVRVTGAVVQPAGVGLQSCPEAMSDVLRCVIGRGTPPFDLDLTATAPGPISVELTLYVKGGATLRRLLGLTAVDLTGGEQLGVSQLPAAETAQLGSGGSPLSSLQLDDPGGLMSPTLFQAALSVAAPVTDAALPKAPHSRDTAMLPVQNLLHLRPTAVYLGVSFREGNYWVQLLIDPARSDPVCVASAEEVLVNTVIAQRNELIQLSSAYRVGAAQADDPLSGLRIREPPEALFRFARIGVQLHRALFGRHGDQAIPLALRTVAATIKQLGRGAAQPPRMQIDAEFLPIPWGIIYDGPEPKTAAEVDLEAFWGIRFQIDRMARVTLTELAPDSSSAESRRVIACLNPNLDAEQKIAVLQSQRAFFQGKPVLATLIESGADLKAFLQATVDEAPCNFLYFFCHATAAQTLNRNLFRDPTSPKEAATIELDKPPLSVEQLCDIRINPLPAQPLVFMNTCSSAQGDSVFQSVFLTHFFGTWRAGGVIGTDWTLPTVFADGFARLFLKHFLIDRRPVADAFHGAARKALELGNPFPLIYALYVRPDYTL